MIVMLVTTRNCLRPMNVSNLYLPTGIVQPDIQNVVASQPEWKKAKIDNKIIPDAMTSTLVQKENAWSH